MLRIISVAFLCFFVLVDSPVQARPGYVCDANGCRPAPQAMAPNRGGQVFQKMPLPILRGNFIKALFGR